ncbi:uncharacterized protein Z520_07269 [Fonsecaea multimorphosa CBS 102226]|uniref:Uncharacterized protein n=1 Tax=Fonsecaea multimorphosa CBS 102226 TaxID=1442371 RepID=A0A0D2H5M6_9EURO|nr:uncharacterized protein Z520_07269 [Fonsecaea multimorphosa CBS 102226]KIX97155.1 hypothetical protein Z520_07269 [Fonsecaea multimorphosa CBS 102226]
MADTEWSSPSTVVAVVRVQVVTSVGVTLIDVLARTAMSITNFVVQTTTRPRSRKYTSSKQQDPGW